MLLTVMWMLYGFFSVYISKYVFVIIDLIARVPKLFGKHRARWISATGVALAVITFVAMWWGALVNRFRVQINEVEVEVAGLPDEFDGYRLLQISDLHTGTFGNDTTFLANLVSQANSLKPDGIAFTGDIVNSRSGELAPHTSTLSRLSAPDGVFAILGNHDYGDYSDWPDSKAKEEDRQALRDMIRSMGWKLLLNQTDTLRRDSAIVAMIGVENVGDPPFHTYGSLYQACPTPDDGTFKILLTHNPAHWQNEIADDDDINIPLTLSGHTHAMQMTILGWSPAVFRYKTWGGLYHDKDSRHQLYVNIGAGTVGFPARIGATPELTLITLRKKTH